uniref:Uncharacterized protein n=1 Tax=Phytophthora ramorum TaxID=164328 RepID=H3GP42_PHYRM
MAHKVLCDVDAAEADEIVAQMQSFNIDKSQTMACTICPEAEHKMRYRFLVCNSEACSEASDLKCAWRGKMVTCLESQHASIFEYGEHHTMASTSTRKKLSTTQKAFCHATGASSFSPVATSWITQKHLIVRFAMADGDMAQCNALATVVGDNPEYRFLMGFFHVMKKTFNAMLKRDYTLLRRLKVGSLLRELSACCQDQSASMRALEFVALLTTTLAQRVFELMRSKLLGIAEGESVDGSFAGSQTVVQVVSLRAPRVIVDPNRCGEEEIAVTAQMGANYARMEVVRQPWGGWAVDVERQ